MHLDLEKWGPPRSTNDLLRCERIVLFGASPAAAEVERFLAANGAAIVAYADNSPAKQASGFGGKDVLSAAAAADFAHEGGAIVIASAYQTEIAIQLTHELGAPVAAIFPYVSDMFAKHFGSDSIAPNRGRIETLIARLADEDSKRYVSALTKFRWTMSPLDLPRNRRVTGFYGYDAAGMGPFPGAHIVDCGAYTGDTAEAYMKRLNGEATITAIEPMPESFAALVDTIRKNGWGQSVRPVNAAVGAVNGVVALGGSFVEPDPRASIHRQGSAATQQVQVAPLDTMFTNRNQPVDLIKIDIEGYELDALEGARKVIGAWKPDLAIAGYHKPAHLWEVPEAIWALDPGYEIHAGHHPSATYEVEFYCVNAARRTKAA
jgi:FkbM family methyltransferase